MVDMPCDVASLRWIVYILREIKLMILSGAPGRVMMHLAH
jgi:hypothetical protein